VLKLSVRRKKVKFLTATESDLLIFAGWRESDRPESVTCRPIIDGRRIPPTDRRDIFAFFVSESIEPVGKVVFFDHNPRNRSVEFGYTVNPAFRGRGIGRLMLREAIAHGFRDGNLNKLYCQTGAFNGASCRLLESLGFHRDAVLRQHHELEGVLWDDYIYSLLREEWRHPPIGGGE
jgi:[ribosomal protein S5]-alanine N-acetyltransferase